MIRAWARSQRRVYSCRRSRRAPSSGAIEAGIAALRWLVEGYGYEITSADVWSAYTNTMKAAEKAGCVAEVRDRIRRLLASEAYANRFVSGILGRELGL